MASRPGLKTPAIAFAVTSIDHTVAIFVGVQLDHTLACFVRTLKHESIAAVRGPCSDQSLPVVDRIVKWSSALKAAPAEISVLPVFDLTFNRETQRRTPQRGDIHDIDRGNGIDRTLASGI